MTKINSFKTPLFVGVDVGGTNVKIGVVDDDGQIVAESKFPTQPDQPSKIAFQQAKQELGQLLEHSGYHWNDVAHAGLGTPGPMDIQAGMILTPTNLPGWHDSPVVEELSTILAKPVVFANDAAAAAFGEFWIGSGKRFGSMVLLTLGTGVGGGIIVEDISIDGAHSHGAEVGHIIIDTSDNARVCGCGQPGHLEAYASASALVERTREAMSGGNNIGSLLRKKIGEASPLSALMISQAAEEGDQLAIEMIAETARFLGIGIAQLAHTIDPEVFILGGAMNFGGNKSTQGRMFLTDVMDSARKLIFPVLGEKLKVQYAELGSEAGYVGAAGLARNKWMKSKVDSGQTV